MGEHSCIWYIRSLDFFPRLSEESMVSLAHRSEMIQAKRGDRITVESAERGFAYLVKEGHLRALRRTEDGHTMALDVLRPGDVIGLTAILTEGGDAEFAEAIDEVLFCRVRTTVLRSILEENPGVTLQVSKRVGLRRRKIELRLLDIAFCTVRVRLSRLLVELAQDLGQKGAQEVLIQVRLTHQEIADLIGCNREAANRATASLVDDGAIRWQGKNLVVTSLPRLRALAQTGSNWSDVSADTPRAEA